MAKSRFLKAAGISLAIIVALTSCDDVLSQLKDEIKLGQQTKQEKLDFSLVLENTEPEARYSAIIYGTDGAPVAGAEGTPLADDSVVFAFLVLPGEYGLKVTEKAGAAKTTKTDSVVFVDGLPKVVIGWDGLPEADAAEEPVSDEDEAVEETDTEDEAAAEEPEAVEETDTEEEAVAEEPPAVEETDTEEEAVAEEPPAVEETDTEEEAVEEKPEVVEDTDTEEEAVTDEPEAVEETDTEEEAVAEKPAIIRYTVRFDTNGGSVVAPYEVRDGYAVLRPAANPTKERNNFAGWFADAALTTPYDFNGPVLSDITIYAKWDIIPAVYGIELDLVYSHYTSAILGYEAQAARVVTITNTGNVPTGALTLALSGGSADAFELSPTPTVPSILAGATGSFTVRPKTGLPWGTHIATVTVSGANGISESFYIFFRVD